MTQASAEFVMTGTAEAEVIRNPNGVECAALHPGEPCPGYPHTAQEG